MLVIVDGRRIDLRDSPVAFGFLVLLGEKPNKDLGSKEVKEMARETGSTGYEYNLASLCMATLRRKIELDPQKPRILTSVRQVGVRTTYVHKLNANVVFTSTEKMEIEEPTQTFTLPDGFEISDLTAQEMEVAKNIPFYRCVKERGSEVGSRIQGKGSCTLKIFTQIIV